MNINDIVNIVNYSLIGAFIFVIVVLCFSFIRGLFRGWRYGTYRLGYFLLHILLGVACLTIIAEAIGTIPLSSILNQQSATLNFSDVTISFQVSTLEGTMNDLITQLIRHYSPATDPTSAVKIAYSLARSFLMIITLICEGILLATVFNFFCFLLWHMIFKHFIPKKKRKESYKRGRLISAIEGCVSALLVTSMILIPSSSLINSLVHGFNVSTSGNEEGKTVQADDSTYQMVKSVADTYNNSVFSQAFFNWNTDKDGYSFDQRIMNWLTSSSYDGVTISFVKELQYASEIGTYAIETGILSESASNAHKAWMFLSSEYSPLLIRSLAKSDLLTGLLPFAFSVMTNMDSVEAMIGNQWNIDYTKNDWSKTITNIADLFSDIQETGILGTMTYSEESDKIIYDTSNEIDLFSEEKSKKFEDAFSRIKNDNDSWDIFNKLLISFSVNTVINSPNNDDALTFMDFLPAVSPRYYEYDEAKGRNVPIGEIPPEYASLDLGQEISYIYRSFSRLNNLDHDFVGSLIDGLLKGQFDMKEFSSLIVDNIDEVISIFTGEGEDGLLRYDENGISENENCLLDCSLICNAMPKILKMLGNGLTQSVGVTSDLTKVNQDIFYDSDSELLPINERIKNEKTEISNLLSVASTFAKNEAGKRMLKDFDKKPGITYNKDGSLNHIDDELLLAFISSIEKIDSSTLLSKIIPDLFEGIFSKNPDMFSSFSLTAQDFDFHPENEGGDSILGHELSSLLRMYQRCQDLIGYIKDNTESFSSNDGSSTNLFLKGLRPFLKQDGGSIIDSPLFVLLNAFGSNKILNPTKDDGSETNYLKVMNKIITSALGDAYSFDGTIPNPEKENAAICEILSSLIDQDLLDVFGNDSISLSSFAYVNFEELLSPLDGTTMMKSVFAYFLNDKLIKDVLNCQLAGINFQNVTDWGKEGLALNEMVAFATSIGDFKNIDLMNGDPDALSGIISVLSQNEMFVENTNYHFGEFFYDTFINGISDESTKKFFSDKDNELTFYALESDIKAITKEEWENEASIYGKILSSIELFGGMDLLSAAKMNFKDLNVDGFASLMDSLASSSSIGRVLSYHIYEKIGEELQTNSFELGNGYGQTGINTKTGNMNLEEIWLSYNSNYHGPLKRNEEFSLFPKILGVVVSQYGLLDSDGKFQKTIDIDSTSTEFLIKPLLTYMSESMVFNSLPSSSNSNSIGTALENVIADLAYQSGIYGNDESNKDETFATVLGYVMNLRDLDDETRFLPDTGKNDFSSNFARFINEYATEIATICSAMDESRSIGVEFQSWKGGNLPVSISLEPRKVVIANSVISSLKTSKIFGPAMQSA